MRSARHQVPRGVGWSAIAKRSVSASVVTDQTCAATRHDAFFGGNDDRNDRARASAAATQTSTREKPIRKWV